MSSPSYCTSEKKGYWEVRYIYIFSLCLVCELQSTSWPLGGSGKFMQTNIWKVRFA